MTYANIDDLAAYLGVDCGALPDDAERMLQRASEDVEYITLGNIREANPVHMAAAKRATCAQVERWLTEGDDTGDITQALASFSIGKWSQTYAGGAQGANGGRPIVAPRARRALLMAGLLYRGVGMS